MEASLVQSAKMAIVAATGLSRDVLHLHIGLAAFFSVAAITRRSLGSLVPWFAVVLLASVGEALDWHDDVRSLGYWRWEASLHDLLNTVFWPTVLLLVYRFSSRPFGHHR
ncbi:hypothetical protein [uncultured Piscinibacter sp.]|uniref:hypothetical protein n=1 Tax=uncultured Piscinibacter sp. TaxID=1131835 RepID=UPI002626A707|nr:hypothetical protein [uncultured Piscinibacter sp.]